MGDILVPPVKALESKGVVTSSSPSAGIGYATGAGAAVTQITSATTAVALEGLSGQITTVASTLAAGLETSFTVTDSVIKATDVIVLSTTYAGAGLPQVYCQRVAAGSFIICISNLDAAAALNALLVINFAALRTVSA